MHLKHEQAYFINVHSYIHYISVNIKINSVAPFIYDSLTRYNREGVEKSTKQERSVKWDSLNSYFCMRHVNLNFSA